MEHVVDWASYMAWARIAAGSLPWPRRPFVSSSVHRPTLTWRGPDDTRRRRYGGARWPRPPEPAHERPRPAGHRAGGPGARRDAPGAQPLARPLFLFPARVRVEPDAPADQMDLPEALRPRGGAAPGAGLRPAGQPRGEAAPARAPPVSYDYAHPGERVFATLHLGPDEQPRASTSSRRWRPRASSSPRAIGARRWTFPGSTAPAAWRRPPPIGSSAPTSSAWRVLSPTGTSPGKAGWRPGVHGTEGSVRRRFADRTSQGCCGRWRRLPSSPAPFWAGVAVEGAGGFVKEPGAQAQEQRTHEERFEERRDLLSVRQAHPVRHLRRRA